MRTHELWALFTVTLLIVAGCFVCALKRDANVSQPVGECAVDQDTLAARITCGIKHATLTDSRKGLYTAFNNGAIVDIIDPCGPSTNDEILVRLSDGTLRSWYGRLSDFEYTTDSYITLDAQRCTFTVDDYGTIVDAKGNTWTYSP